MTVGHETQGKIATITRVTFGHRCNKAVIYEQIVIQCFKQWQTLQHVIPHFIISKGSLTTQNKPFFPYNKANNIAMCAHCEIARFSYYFHVDIYSCLLLVKMFSFYYPYFNQNRNS